jgi:hypothetical protein
MKTLKIIVFILSCAFFVACQKNSPVPASSNLPEAVLKAIGSPTILSLRQSYALLTVSEKQSLWQTKLDAILVNDADKLTCDQRKIVQSFRNLAEKNSFSHLIKDGSTGENFVNTNMSYFKKHFSSEQLYFLFECCYYRQGFSIFKTAEYLSALTETSYNTPPEGTVCTCYYSVYCETTPHQPGNSCISKNNPCQKVKECGLFSTSNCTGTCQ